MLEKDNEYSALNLRNSEKKYWNHVIEKIENDNEAIPKDRNNNDTNYKIFSKVLEENITKDLKAKFGENDMLRFTVMTSSVKIMLSLLYDSKDTKVWAPCFNNNTHEGIVTNKSVVFIDYLEDEVSLKDILNRVKQTVIDAYKNQHVEVSKIYEACGYQRQNIVGLAYNRFHSKEEIAAFLSEDSSHILFEFVENEDMVLNILYDGNAYYEDTIKSISDVVEHIIFLLLYNREKLLYEVEICSSQEVFKYIYGKEGSYPEKENIIEAFRRRVASFGNKTAVIYGDKCVTYLELEERSNQLARYLVETIEVLDSNYIGILMNKSDDIIVAALAVLKVGKAYVPINLEYPLIKQKEIIEDAKIRMIITEKAFIGTINQLQWQYELFTRFLCMDSGDIYSETEVNKNDLMSKEVWEYVAKQADNQIAQGAWISSYTDEEISVEEMKEYSDNVLKKLMPYLNQDVKVLEIGCASGLTMYKIAPYVKLYYGTDLSENTIITDEKYNAAHNIKNIRLKAMPADAIDQIKEQFDIIIINSVIQCFDGHNYLRKVMKKAVSKLKDKGIVFAGDIMDLAKKQDLIDSLTKFKRKNSQYNTKLSWENELFLDKRYFEDLVYEVNGIIFAEPSDKIYTIENELTLFRYDVILKIDKNKKNQLKHRNKNKYQDDWTKVSKYETTSLTDIEIKPDCAAYVIYTSGTMGKSKGVIVEHKNLINLVLNKKIPYDFNEKDTWTLFHSFCFDFSVWEMYGALLTGARLVIISKELARDTQNYYKCLIENQVSVLNQTPGAFYNLIAIDEENGYLLSHIRHVVFGGEALNPQKICNYIKHYPNTKYINMYGITETTIHVTHKDINTKEADTNISNIGGPLPNYSCYVMNRFMKQVPFQVAGELVVGGNGVSRGYLNREELTKEKFIVNPYNKNERLYRSGDLVKRLCNGDLQYLGRTDQQIKIRGHRIEKGEVEQAVLAIDVIRNAYVTDLKVDNNETILCCYYSAAKALPVKELNNYLSIMLPDYCIPSYFVYLDEIPLNKNGKVNKSELPNPLKNIYCRNEYVGPETEYEKEIADLWKELLGLDKVGINENFFELGGHSLKATMFSSRIIKKYGIKIPLTEIFLEPTIKQLGQYMEKNSTQTFENIPKAEVKELYQPISIQKRFYFIQKINEESIAYNMPIAIESKQTLDADRILAVNRKLIQKHQTLRISFVESNNDIMQKVNTEVEADFEVIVVNDSLKRQEMIDNFVKPFDLSKAPLMRIKVLKTENEKDVLLFDMHHIISDGVSMNIIIQDFVNLYYGLDCSENSMDYTDFSEWFNSIDRNLQKKFWLDMYKDEVAPLLIQTDFRRPQIKSFEGECQDYIIEEDIKKAVKALCNENKTTEFIFLSAVMAVLLSKYSEQQDIVIGVPVTGRRNAKLNDIVGLFINTLPIRFRPDNEMTFKEYLEQVKDTCVNAFENQEYPIDELIEELRIKNDASRNPLFDVMFVMQNQNELRHMELRDFDHILNEQKASKMDITFIMEDINEGYSFHIEYCNKLFTKDTINRMKLHYVELIQNILNNPVEQLKNLDMLNQAEKNKILMEFNDTAVPIDYKKSIIDLFEIQAASTPDAIALLYKDEKITYRQLNESANRLAHAIKEKGVKQGESIAIISVKSIELIVGIYAVLKAGCCYVPIDYKYPDRRIKSILEISQTAVVLTDHSMAQRMDLINPLSHISLNDWETWRHIITNPERKEDNESTIYIIFTSGTTGEPKGVEVTNKNVKNFLLCLQKEYPVDESCCYLFKTVYTFDVSITEIFGWFIGGGRLAILEQNAENDPEEIVEAIEKYHVTHINFVSSMLRIFFRDAKEKADKMSSLQYIMVAGEKFHPELVEMCKEINADVRLSNLYGPTETTVYATHYKLDISKKYERVTIGRPLDNTKILVLDKYQKLCGILIPGELCICGDSVSKGYKNNSQLTEEKYIIQPLYSDGKIYKSGDKAYWNADGTIEILGRMDEQVKVRGFRIELDEITSAFKELEHVTDAAVIIKKVNKENELYAYYEANEAYDMNTIRNMLKKLLPEYMIPNYIMQIEKLPLTANQKLDKKALPEIVLNHIKDEYLEPQGFIESKVAEAFKKVLNCESVGRNDNFFDLGGHSLKLIVVVNMLKSELEVELKIKEIFENLTVSNIAQIIENKGRKQIELLTKTRQMEFYPVTDEQLDMFLAYEIYKDNLSYNMPCAFRIKGNLNVESFISCIKSAVLRHEILRTRFVKVDNQVVQKVYHGEDFEIQYVKSIKSDEEELKDFVKPFQLEKDYMIKVKFLKRSKDEYTLLLDIHHIIIDGVSIGILLREILASYQGEKLEEVNFQFKDYSVWREKYDIQKEKQFWNKRIDNTIQSLELDTVYERKSHISLEGDCIIVSLDQEFTQRIREVIRSYQCTLFQFLFSIFHMVLYKHSQNNDIVIGAVTAGRNHSQLEDILGMFVKTLPVRNQMGLNESYVTFLERVKNEIVEVFDNNNYTFQNILIDSGVKAAPGHHPLFDVAMVVQNLDLSYKEIEDITIESIEISNQVSKYDIFLEANDREDNIELKFEYCKALFNKKYMNHLSSEFCDLINKVIDNGDDLIMNLVQHDCNVDNFEDIEEIDFDI